MSDLIYHIFWPNLLVLPCPWWIKSFNDGQHLRSFFLSFFFFIRDINNELIKSSFYLSGRLFRKYNKETQKKRERERQKKERKSDIALLYNRRELHWQDFRVWILHKKSYPPSRTFTRNDDMVIVVVALTYLFTYFV